MERVPVLVSRAGPVTTITIDRPERMNALDYAARVAMAEAFDAFAADPSQWVAIVTASGDRAFSAGLDLKELGAAAGNMPEMPPSGFGGLTDRMDLAKPVIAAVNGLAAGGGFELALACDIVVAADHAWFALPEPDVGLAALAGGLVRLARAVGEKRATEIALTRRRIPAAEALVLGLVTDVVAASDLQETARALARQLCAAGPLAQRATKQIIQRSLGTTLAEAMRAQWSYPAVEALLASSEPAEGARAFVEKRSADWWRP